LVDLTDLTDLWLDIVYWGGGTGFTLGLVGAAVAFVLRFQGYRRVSEVPDAPGWGTSYELGAPLEVKDWFTSWTLVGGILGGCMGVVFWFDRVT
jgi:hypothetical protein